MARLSTHVLDTVKGGPAAGVTIELFRLAEGAAPTLVNSVKTNHDGRTDAPLLAGEAFTPGLYELVFHIGGYFRASLGSSQPMFLETVPLRVNLTDTDGHYHVPLLCTPWSYSTYRGS